MKKAGNLIEKIIETSNLELAYYKAKKGKTDKPDVIEFGKQLYINLNNLQQQILTGNIETGKYKFFTIYDPKKRIISAAPFCQRVLHHAIMNICHPYFEKKQIYDSYANRVKKGTYAAISRAAYYNKRYKWFLKLDFRKYFDSLNHNILKQQLKSVFKDTHLLKIFDCIINSYSVASGRGVPIGNLTSQYFSNHYLAGADHYVKETLCVPGYVRYMDDMILWHNNKQILLSLGHKFREYTEKYLCLTLKPFCFNKNIIGLPFLGYILYPHKVNLSARSRNRFIEKVKIYTNNLKLGKWSQKEFQNHIVPLISFTEHANTKAYRRNIMQDNSLIE